MPSYRWSRLIAVLCGVGSASWGTAASAYQFLPISDDINTRFIHQPDAWVGGGFRSSGNINQSPAEFGPAPGMWQRSADGNPASGDRFSVMTPGPLPGGLSPDGFNGSGMRPPVNQIPSIANNPLFGGNGQSPFGSNDPNNPNRFGPNGSMPQGQNTAGQNTAANRNPSESRFGQPLQPAAATRLKPKTSWALDTAQQPFVGLLGQIAKPGVYEIERRGTLLGDLLQNIGGLAKDASGQFRIIRNGRPLQMTSYSGAAHFELMAGDLIVADAQPSQLSQRATNAKLASADTVQIGFVNLADRPVVLKLRNEHATVYEILSIMRQDQNLASQITIVTPSSQRGQGQPRLDATLASETVLIFPPNSVKTERLAMLPEPFKIKRDADTPVSSPDAAQPPAPRSNISPDVTQSPSSRPTVGSWTDSTSLPQMSQTISRPRSESAPEVAEVPPPPVEDVANAKRASGVRGTPRRTSIASDKVARDSSLPFAPPAEGSTPSPRDVPTTVVAQDNAPAPELSESELPDDDHQLAEPSLLNAKARRRPIPLAKDHESKDDTLTAADLEQVETDADKAGSGWSIWPPILTAGAGFLTLIGFSEWLRRRTQAATQTSPVAMAHPQPLQSIIRNPQSTQRRDLLDEIIDDQLPLTEEHVPFASPMQFHGRPQPQKTIRMDQRHPLPKPHSPDAAGVRGQGSEIRGQAPATSEPEVTSAPRTAATASQKFRIDRIGASGAKIVAPTPLKASSNPPISGTLDRVLSAVQKREERGA